MRRDFFCRVLGASLCVIFVVGSNSTTCEAAHVDGNESPSANNAKEQIANAVEAAIPYLTEEGRAWMDGLVPIQDGQNCVSCHQVPSGVWALDSAFTSLEQQRSDDLVLLIDDAVDFISDPTIGRPAMWSQLLIVMGQDADDESIDEQQKEDIESWIEPILESQQSDGRFQAKGQFPSQKRPIDESDAVITMWMIAGLGYFQGNDDLKDSKDRAIEFVKSTNGVSTEWLAWRALTPIDGDETRERSFLEQLRQRQRDDGGFGWTEDAVSDPYSTGVALFALSRQVADSEAIQHSRAAAAKYLLDNQTEDGTWKAPSALITKKGSDSRDYVYHYWGTAWAVIGLASEYEKY